MLINYKCEFRFTHKLITYFLAKICDAKKIDNISCYVFLKKFCILDIIAWQELFFQSLVPRDIFVQNLPAQCGSPVHPAHIQTRLVWPLSPNALTVQLVS